MTQTGSERALIRITHIPSGQVFNTEMMPLWEAKQAVREGTIHANHPDGNMRLLISTDLSIPVKVLLESVWQVIQYPIAGPSVMGSFSQVTSTLNA